MEKGGDSHKGRDLVVCCHVKSVVGLEDVCIGQDALISHLGAFV